MLTLNEIKNKYDGVGSFAIWSKIDPTKRPKYGVGDMGWLRTFKHKHINKNVVFVGLNISGKIDIPFSNFHSSKSTAHDYKIRYAVENSPFTCAYMTDIIKDHEEKISGNVMKYLNSNPDFVKTNISIFENEIKDIGLNNPTIIAFGNDAYKIMKKYKLHEKYKIFKVSHYSSCISKEKLRDAFNEISKLI